MAKPDGDRQTAKSNRDPEAQTAAQETLQPFPSSPLFRQGWASIAVWMAVGLLLEGLLGYKIPAYLEDAQRRELFRLAHAHGTLLGLLLIVVGLYANRVVAPARFAGWALRVGTLLMPVGFLLAGVWHTEGDPGIFIWLVPPAALLILFAVVSLALTRGKG